ncbi:hypothetical protein EXQ38_11660 [Clostridium botulinum]|nr:hypothetical protein [Clostridium botulinum]
MTQSYLSRLESNAKYNKNITIGLIKKNIYRARIRPCGYFLIFLPLK